MPQTTRIGRALRAIAAWLERNEELQNPEAPPLMSLAPSAAIVTAQDFEKFQKDWRDILDTHVRAFTIQLDDLEAFRARVQPHLARLEQEAKEEASFLEGGQDMFSREHVALALNTLQALDHTQSRRLDIGDIITTPSEAWSDGYNRAKADALRMVTQL